MTVRGVGESHEAVKQTDSGFEVDAQAGPEGAPLEFWLALPTRTLPHDLVMGGDSHAGSQQPGKPNGCVVVFYCWLDL